MLEREKLFTLWNLAVEQLSEEKQKARLLDAQVEQVIKQQVLTAMFITILKLNLFRTRKKPEVKWICINKNYGSFKPSNPRN